MCDSKCVNFINCADNGCRQVILLQDIFIKYSSIVAVEDVSNIVTSRNKVDLLLDIGTTYSTKQKLRTWNLN